MVENHVKENQDENLQVNMKLVSFYSTEGGTVFIYKVVPPSEALLEEFYVVSFDNLHNEIAWGLGPTPEAALKSAAMEWDRTSDEEERNTNPFKEVLSQFSQ